MEFGAALDSGRWFPFTTPSGTPSFGYFGLDGRVYGFFEPELEGAESELNEHDSEVDPDFVEPDSFADRSPFHWPTTDPNESPSEERPSRSEDYEPDSDVTTPNHIVHKDTEDEPVEDEPVEVDEGFESDHVVDSEEYYSAAESDNQPVSTPTKEDDDEDYDADDDDDADDDSDAAEPARKLRRMNAAYMD